MLQRRARRVADSIKEVGPPEAWPDPLGNVAMNLGVRPQDFPEAGLHQSDGCPTFFLCTSAFAASPHLSRHPRAAAVGFGRRGEEWDWTRGQGREGVSDPAWWHGKLIDPIGIIPCRPFRRIGSCRYPLYFSPKMALALRELRSLVPECRIKANARRMEPTHSVRAPFWNAVLRNLGRARWRWFRVLAASKVADDGPIRTEGGGISHEPSDDEPLGLRYLRRIR